MTHKPVLPSDVSDDVGLFDRFATVVSRVVASAPFFVVCLGMVVVWPASFLFLAPDTAQLLINTATTIVTFLLVALLQNSQHRADLAVQHKLNAIAQGLADLMDENEGLDGDQAELRDAVGLERRESS